MAQIPPEIIDQILGANDIVEVIGSYFPLKRAGGTYKALCPFHQERSPSFTVNPQRQIFKCFGCGAGGTALRFVMDYEHLPFPEAARKLAERAGIRLEEHEFTAEEQERVDLRRRLLALHADAAEWFHKQLLRARSAEPAREYLKKRGLSAEVAKSWKIGFAPDGWRGLCSWAQENGFTPRELIEGGLAKRSRDEEEAQYADGDGEPGKFYDTFRNRVMFPICNDRGEVIAFSGRTLEANPSAGKYVNSPETPLFIKGKVLFGLHRSIRSLINQKSAIVCEGQIDLITAFEAGVTNVIAPQGTAFTADQARILKRYVEEVVLCFDSDAAGEKAAERSTESLLGENLAVRVAAMPAGEDPDSLIRREGGPAFQERMKAAKDFFTFQVERMTKAADFQTPKGKAAATHKLANWVSLIKDAALREAVMGQVTVRLEISMRQFSEMLGKVRHPQKGGAADAVPENLSTPLTDPACRLLALAALHDQAAMDWLRLAPYRELLAREADAALVVKILESSFAPGDRVTQQSFLSSLPAADEATISELLSERPPAHAEMQASDCWNALVRRQIQAHLESLKARLRAPELKHEERMGLMVEVQDYTGKLKEIPPPVAPPL